ncbi:K(+)/H(+) antiporter [Globomyces sp. JEL0801]|nr:K(+)/H(+) antiporter [Globomyces sp. JEL0801]
MAGSNGTVTSGSFLDGDNPLKDNAFLFVVQLLIITITCRIFGFILSYLNQPSVIAEVVGGIALGPTGLSRLPWFKETFFPKDSLPKLKVVAEVALILYLFLVGMELDPVKIKNDFKKSAFISIAGILVPFATGLAVSKLIYDTYIEPSVPLGSFLIFCGVAMSITAFPVLARILTERKLLSTSVGQSTLAAAATDDAVAWSLLVLVVALINNPDHALNAVWVFLIVAAYAIFLFVVIRPFFVYLINSSSAEHGASQSTVFIVFGVMLIFTGAAGVHTIFGAFLTGLIIPHDRGFAIAITEKLEDMVSILFLPLYFAYSGLNTQLGELNDIQAWGFVALIFATACCGKILGCLTAARIGGNSWRESLTIGILMNTKGLVEIIVLNLGLQAGVINQKVFTMFLMMALFTTFMTVPIVSIIYPMSLYSKKESSMSKDRLGFEESQATIPDQGSKDTLQVLICLPNMKTVPAMMNITQMFFQSNRGLDIYALRLVDLGQRMSHVMKATESSETMQSDPVINVFRTFGQLNNRSIKTLMSVSQHETFSNDAIDTAAEMPINLIIFPIEHANNTYPSGWAVGTAKHLFDSSPCPISFFVDRGFGVSSVSQLDEPFAAFPGKNQQIFFPFYGTQDDIEAAVVLNYLAHSNVLNEPAPDSLEGQALTALESFPNVTVERPATPISSITLIARANSCKSKDLIILGHSSYENVEDDTLKSWLDGQAKSSYMIVKKPNSQPLPSPKTSESSSLLKRRTIERSSSNLV